MIQYSLQCDREHGFDAWFGSSADYDRQKAAGLVTCPFCDSKTISKMLMAPNVTTGRQKEKSQAVVMDTMRRDMIARLKDTVKEIRAKSEDVGERFPDEARKIHYGETEARGIIGQASPDEVEALFEEGIEIAALPVFPEDQH